MIIDLVWMHMHHGWWTRILHHHISGFTWWWRMCGCMCMFIMGDEHAFCIITLMMSNAMRPWGHAASSSSSIIILIFNGVGGAYGMTTDVCRLFTPLNYCYIEKKIKKRGCCSFEQIYRTMGLISADRSNKATLLLTIPRSNKVVCNGFISSNIWN